MPTAEASRWLRAPAEAIANPAQHTLMTRESWRRDRYRITALARFEIEARVLGSQRYAPAQGGDIAPVDLVLGWGPMAHDDLTKEVSFSQRERFYFWRTSDVPGRREIIEHYSANMHMMPASDSIRAELMSLEPGSDVYLRGFLVEVLREDGWRWRSSLTRDDTGDGACELVWVEAVLRR